MRGGNHYISYALLILFDRVRLIDAFLAPRPHGIWTRNPDQAMNISGPPTTGNSTSLYPASHFNVSEECILWDNTCQGDKQKAANIFFNQTLEALLENECFTGTDSARAVVVGLNEVLDERPAEYDPGQCPGGTTGIPPATSSLWSTLKSWMREPACASSSIEYGSAFREPSAQEVMYGCCGPCAIDGPNVDVYYWPSPEANTSCLSIIGTSVNPPTQGATTAGGFTYWGYTPADANIYNQIVTTMVYTEINGIWFKMPMSNPWESKPGASVSTNPGMWNMPSTALPSWSTPKIQRREDSLESTIQARANPIAIPNLRRAPINESSGNSINNDSSLDSTVIYGSHTFTSPSIYVDFYSLSATDSCGYRGPPIKSTLLAFTPGELSTIATAMYAAQQNGVTTGSVYNFDDLPCPPMSIMSSQWYKPEPGEPFRPLIVFPSKLLSIHPLWKICTPGYFTGYDPPRTLDLETALVPKVTPSSTLNPNLETPKPAATLESLPKKTSISADPTITQSDPSLAKSHGSSGVQDNSSQKNEPPKDTKTVPVDPSTNNQGSSDSQGQSPQATPASRDSNDGPMDHTLPNTAANSDPNQQLNKLNANKGAPFEDGDTANEPPPLTPPSASSATAISTNHVASVDAKDSSITSINFNPSASATGASGEEFATIDDQTVYISPPTFSFVTNIASHILTPLPSGVAIQGTILEPGAPAATIAGTKFSLDASSNIFINDHSYPIPTNPTSQPTTINNEAVFPLPTGILINSKTLTPGAPALIISGQSYSLDPSNNLFVNDDHSYHIPKPPPLLPTTTINSEAVIPWPAGLSIHSTTLMPGAPGLETEGPSYSLDSSNNLHHGSRIEAMTKPVGTGADTSMGGLPSPGSENKNGSRMSGDNNSTMLVFTGGTGRTKVSSVLFAVAVAVSVDWWVGVCLEIMDVRGGLLRHAVRDLFFSMTK